MSLWSNMVKAALCVFGVLTGLVLWGTVPHYVESYAQRGLPPEYPGPRYRRWMNGIEVSDGKR